MLKFENFLPKEELEMVNFETAQAIFEELGIEYTTAYEYRGTPGLDRESHNLPIFESIKIPFTPEEWVQIAMRDGLYYIGGCCGSSSSMQDQVCYWFREGGWVKIRDLSHLADQQVEHDGKEHSPFHVMPDLLGKIEDGMIFGSQRNPWDILAALWHLTRNSYEPEKLAAAGDHLLPIEKTIKIVERACRVLNWGYIFSERDEQGNPKPPGVQEKIDRSLILARFIPAMKTLWEHVGDLYYGPVDAFAVVETEKGPNAICERSRNGYAIFESEALIEEIFDLWDRVDSEYKEQDRGPRSRDRYRIRPVRVTLKGIIFTDTGDPYEGVNSL